MSIGTLYCRRVKKDSRLYYAQWFPTATIDLGQIGKLVDGAIFVPKTTLQQQGIPFEIAQDPSSAQLNISSSSEVKVTFKLGGEVSTTAPSIPKASAGVVVEFGRKAAYIIKSEEVYEPRIANVAALEAEILARVKARTWDPDWVVISQIVQAPKADILVSESSSSRVEITAKGSANVGEVVQLGSINASFDITSQSGKVANFLNSKQVTPLFQLVGLKRRLFGNARVTTLNKAIQPGSVSTLTLDELASDAETDVGLYLDVIS
jgi:hypothetical protein